jgi:hypothetical protein
VSHADSAKIAALKRKLVLEPQDGAARLELAEALFGEGDPARAAQTLTWRGASTRLDGNARRLLVQCLRRMGKLEEARHLLEEQGAAGADPAEVRSETGEVLDALAEELLARGRRDDALLQLETAQELAPARDRRLRIAKLLVDGRSRALAAAAVLDLLRDDAGGPAAVDLARALRLEGALLSAPELDSAPAALQRLRDELRRGALATAKRELALAPDELRGAAAFVLLKAEVLVQEGRPDRALDLLESAGVPHGERLLAAEKDPDRTIGVLGWNPLGGCVSPVQAVAVPGGGVLHFTGNVGPAGREAAELAYACVKARARELGLSTETVAARDLHLHYADTELAKDGSSAGLALALATAAALSERPLLPALAATGEITLHGEVRAIAGVHEKLVAATLARISVVLLPRRNLAEVRELPRAVHARVRILPVDTLSEATRLAMEPRR